VVLAGPAEGPVTPGRLAELLCPHDVADFLASGWGRVPLHIPGPASRFAGLGIDSAVLEEAIRDREVRAGMRLRFVGPDDKVDAVPDDVDLFSVRDARHTVCVDHIDEHYPALAAYCTAVKADLSHCGPVFMSCYASPRGHGFGTHLDYQPSFVLQLEGAKRWRVSARPAVAWPPVIITGPRVLPELRDRYPWIDVDFPTPAEQDEFDEYLLTPGDVLYFPAGTWHRASAEGDRSVAVTLACTPLSAADVVDDVVRGMLSENVAWRSSVPPVPPGAQPPDRLPQPVREFLDARLHELREMVAGLRADDLYATWLHHVTASGTSAPPPAAAARVSPADVLERAADSPVRWVSSTEGVSLHHRDRRIDLDADALPLLQRLADPTPATARRLAGLVDGHGWDAVAPVLDAMVAAGVLRISEAEPARAVRGTDGVR
jgi:lysine-specific demethylase/histidyl-hydroxylase NO66